MNSKKNKRKLKLIIAPIRALSIEDLEMARGALSNNNSLPVNNGPLDPTGFIPNNR